MPLYGWRRFRSPKTTCATGADSGQNYTSHHLRCGQIESGTTPKRSRQQLESDLRSRSSSWPGTKPTCSKEEDDSYSNIWTPPSELRYSYDEESERSQRTSSPRTVSAQTSFLLASLPRQPPRCRLPPSMRFTTLILYITVALILLSSPAIAAPCTHQRAIHGLQLFPRQAIPDKTGQTGNEPAPVRPDPIPLPETTTTTFASSPTPTSAPTPTTTANPKPTTFIPGPSGNGNTNFPNQIGNQPLPLPTPFPIAGPTFTLSTGAIAGISAGCGALALIFVFIGFCIYRRRRRIDVIEIPIRRSKLGSRLGFRIFGDMISPSRVGSRRGSAVSVKSDGSRSRSPTQGKKLEAGWLDKGIIGRPKPAWLENGFLSVPKPGFLKEENKKVDEDSAPWVDKETISKPRPARPRSAEPLGRMSGMGLGMGYLK